MTRRYVNLFMWGYQEHFAIQVRRCAMDVLERIGGRAVFADILTIGQRFDPAKERDGGRDIRLR